MKNKEVVQLEKVKESQGRYQFNFSWLWYIPIMIGVGIIPLIMRMTIVDITDQEYADLFNQVQIVDIFSQYKAGSILGIAAVMLIMLFLSFNKKDLKVDKVFKIMSIGVGIYLIFTVLSGVLSQHQDIAWWGAADRAEGTVVLLAYIVMMYYTYYMVQKKENIQLILIPLGILTCIVAILGICQYVGKDIVLTTDWGKNLIVPEAYAQYREGLSGVHGPGKMYGTMYHYNYVGSFGALIVPIFLTLFLFMHNIKYRVVFGGLTVCGTIVLLGSTSRAGLIGVGLTSVVFVIVFSKRILKSWKWIVPIAGIGLIGVIVLNSALGGKLFARIPSLISDAIQLVQSPSEQEDFKQKLPIQGLQESDNKVILKTSQGDMVIRSAGQEKAEEQTLIFQDIEGNVIPNILDGETYRFEDERFIHVTIDRRTELSETASKWLVEYDKERIFYLGVEQDKVYYVNPITYERDVLEDPKQIGFYGKERLGSARGYIWSRSLPLLKDTLITGYGPDNYALYFPQDDYLGKWYAYGTTNMIVDKPHNLYLQIALNQGVVALVGFMILIGTYIVQSIKLYACRKGYSEFEIIGIAFFLGIIGYLGAGIFNDSVVSVAPIFWILLGTGMAVNFIIQKERRDYEKTLEYATILMKNKKHI